MTAAAQARLLADGRRLHLHHGPIDLIVEAFASPAERAAAYRRITARFATMLEELVGELSELRRPASAAARPFRGPTARRMERAVCPLSSDFITPMAAVAGAVADETLAALLEGGDIEKAYVNDGGDIALFLSPGQSIRAAVAGTGNGFADRLVVRAEDPVRGIATSGWRGRSHSLGIADAVTVLAKSAAEADAAATIVANAVDLPGHPAVTRVPACSLSPDSDLGDRLVTYRVGPLHAGEIAEALDRGHAAAERLRHAGLIESAALFLGGAVRVCGAPRLAPAREETSREVTVHA
jgi:ApbE superfamily uncharacterized protein (UPF0280 family)